MKKNAVAKNPIVCDDILRYKKNKFAANFALLGLVFNCLYFLLLYSVVNLSIYTVLLMGSVIVNLLVLLIGFYSSEGIKGYDKRFAFVLIALAVVQIARIFILPTMGMAKDYLDGNWYFGAKMTSASNGTIFVIYLAASAACFIVSAVHGYVIAKRLEVFQAKIEKGEIVVEDELKKLETADEAVAAAPVTENAEPETVPATEEKGDGENG